MDRGRKSFMRCVAYGTASGYNLTAIAAAFKRKSFTSKLSRDVFHISSSDTPVDIYVYNHGSVVCWGLKKAQEFKWLAWLKQFALNPLAQVESDHFGFCFGEETTVDTHSRFKLDVITLEADNTYVKMAISYGLAQSIKLETFEEAIQDAIRKNSYLPEEMAVHGKISLSRRALWKRVGEIFIARSSINLSSEYLDMPEFFWRNPNLERYYMMTKQFLDIPSRVTSLNQKLDVLQELLAILSAQVQHRHSSFLEMTIIILILVEIAISLLHL
jgi:uncharacterized Rmd1/YagE family protein